MTLLPSPIPHPLDYSPWELPAWIYQALDWVVGVEWPEGNERTVWDLADQWYGVAEVLGGPRADALVAAAEVRSGYGNVGAVPEAFGAAFRSLAEGDDAPLTVLLSVSSELGRIVEDCGSDIEAAKLEIWIEIGILVVELVSLTIATVLTAGAASPAAGAAIAATRAVIHRIFRRLIGRLAQKSLRQGLKEAGERAAKQVADGGLKSLARRAGREGAGEAAQEAGINLAIQGYQNTTGRRDGLDAAALGTSALGGFAGGAAAPLAGLGRNATGAAQVGELFGREMAGEVIADNAASLVTGGGFVSLEEAARAAASGVTGSALAQGDAALQAKLDGRLATLAGPGESASGSAAVPQPRSTPDGGVVADVTGAEPALPVATPSAAAPPAPLLSPGGPSGAAGDTTEPAPGHHHEVTGESSRRSGSGPEAAPEHPAGDSRAAQGEFSSASAEPLLATATPYPAAAETPAPQAAAGGHSHSPGGSPGGSPGAATVSHPVTAAPNSGGPPPVPMAGAGIRPVPESASVAAATGPPSPTIPGPGNRPEGIGRSIPAVPSSDSRFPLLRALDPQPATPQPTLRAAELTSDNQPAIPRPRTPEWYEIREKGRREGIDRRRHRGYFRAQRARYEEKRRNAEAERLQLIADEQSARLSKYEEKLQRLTTAGVSTPSHPWRVAAHQGRRIWNRQRRLIQAVLAGEVVPGRVDVTDDADFAWLNEDVADLAGGAVRTSDRSALTGDGRPPPIDRSRRYGHRGGLRRPLALHQTDLERHMPLDPDGNVLRTPDPRQGVWFRLANDGGPRADPARAINCLDCTLSLYETWVHGRPRVSAPRTFDGYLDGDINQPADGEAGGPRRVEEVTGGRFQEFCPVQEQEASAAARAVNQGYAELESQLLACGHGSYAFVITCWEQGGSHAWVALNQNGTVLYLDPQNKAVSTAPLFGHVGRPAAGNVVAIDALVLGADGRPLTAVHRPPGLFTSRLPWPETESTMAERAESTVGEETESTMAEGAESTVAEGTDQVGPAAYAARDERTEHGGRGGGRAGPAASVG